MIKAIYMLSIVTKLLYFIWWNFLNWLCP